MTAMTDRDRAVAEKLGWKQRDTHSGRWWTRGDVTLLDNKLRFCSNATWETEGMVIEWLQDRTNGPYTDETDMIIAERILEIVRKRKSPIQSDIHELTDFLLNYQRGDLANALADVIMEAEDV